MLEHRQVPVADVDGTYHVAIMWPKKEAPNLKNYIIFTNSSSASGKNFNPCLYVF